jgi:hypothetical protein
VQSPPESNQHAMRSFVTGATRHVDDSKHDYEGFLSPAVLDAYAAYMHRNRIQADGKVRDSDNWQKGIPRDAYMKSGFRHFMEWWRIHRGADRDSPELRAALCALLFNVMGYLHEVLQGRDAGQQEPPAAGVTPDPLQMFRFPATPPPDWDGVRGYAWREPERTLVDVLTEQPRCGCDATGACYACR